MLFRSIYRQLYQNLIVTANQKSAIDKQIRDGKKVKNINGEDCFLYDDAEANINDAVFYFDGDNLVFIFQSYSLAPYSSGMPMFKIPKDVAMKHIHLK